MEPLPAEQPESETRAVYPPPPNVQWIALFAVQIFFALMAFMLVPRGFSGLVAVLAFDAWAVYLCLWLRKLNPEFMSIFWCSAFIALQIAFTVPGAPIPLNSGITIFAVSLALLALILWIVTIYLIRAEIHFHYNVSEPVGLYLSGVMTFFFSFIYFQYHLYNIAQLKQRNGDKPFYYQGGPSLP
jgi:hypothetical protein